MPYSLGSSAHWHACKGDGICTDTSNNGYALHEGGKANCISGAICQTCHQEYGKKDPDTHTGRTIKKNEVPASTSSKGYSGDIHCKDCDAFLEKGKELAQLNPDGTDPTVPKAIKNPNLTFTTIEGEQVSTKAGDKPKLVIFYGAECGGCISILKSITKQKLNASTLKVENLKDYIFTGEEIMQTELQLFYQKDKNSEKIPLNTETDVNISYKNNVKKGTATITIEAKENSVYQGKVSKTFKILAKPLEEGMKASSMDTITVKYNKQAQKPVEQIRLTNQSGQTLVNGTDYTLSYRNNKEVAGPHSAKVATIVITGKGIYGGSVSFNFTIDTRDVSELKLKRN